MNEWNDETAQWYADKYGEYATNRLGVEAIELQPGMVVMDIGCGTGSALRHAAARVPGASFMGVDPVPRMLQIAADQTAGHPSEASIEFRAGAARALPAADISCDVVLAFDSFDHWQDQAAGLSEVRRVLREGGRFVVVKDGGVPGTAGATLRSKLAEAGFVVQREVRLEEDDVAATLWDCLRP